MKVCLRCGDEYEGEKVICSKCDAELNNKNIPVKKVKPYNLTDELVKLATIKFGEGILATLALVLFFAYLVAMVVIK